MGRLSRQIGLRRRKGEDTRTLIQQMRVLSLEKKALELALKGTRASPSEAEPQMESSQPTADGRGTSTQLHVSSLGPPETLEFALTYDSGEEWDAYVSGHSRSSQYHQYCWKKIIEGSFGHSTYYLSARTASGHLAGVLPLVRIDSRLFGDYVVSLPFVNYGGPLGDSPIVELALMNKAASMAIELGCTHVEYRDTTRKQEWPLRSDKVSMRLGLPPSPSELWRSFSSKLRAQIRRAEREKPIVMTGGAELLPDFYHVFAHNMRDLGTPVYAAEFFQQICDQANSARIVVVRVDNEPVSAGFTLGYRAMFEMPWASTLRSASPLGINMLLYWTVLKYAINSGYSSFDFGRSTMDSGTYRFKKQWGAQPVPLYWHYWLPEGASVPHLNPGNPKFRLAIAVWKRLPVWLANRLGPSIVKNLP